MTSHFRNHYVCNDCGAIFIVGFPLRDILTKWQVALMAFQSFEVDVAEHKMDHVNERVQEVLKGQANG